MAAALLRRVAGALDREQITVETRLRDQIALTQAIVQRAPNAIFLKDPDGRSTMAGADGTVPGLVGSSTGISEMKRIEAELRDQHALTHALIEGNPSAMYLKDMQGRYVTVNDAWLKMVGLEREQALGRTVLELFPRAEAERYHAEDMRLLEDGAGSSEVEARRTGPGGRPQWVIIRKAVLRRADGEVIGLIGANTDITRLKEAEEALAERASFIAGMVDALPISVAVCDPEGR
jgi:two-component system, cell cycle sensor histidine kinase and response regulator CckA